MLAIWLEISWVNFVSSLPSLFAQNILGHEGVEMTVKYVDGRQKEWLKL